MYQLWLIDALWDTVSLGGKKFTYQLHEPHSISFATKFAAMGRNPAAG